MIEGAAVIGMSLALYGEITFKKGRVEQSNYDSYRMLRIDESPPVTDVHIVQNGIDVPSSGVGEPGLPPFAPALCNAIFAATGAPPATSDRRSVGDLGPRILALHASGGEGRVRWERRTAYYQRSERRG
jgi:hypothetical protein